MRSVHAVSMAIVLGLTACAGHLPRPASDEVAIGVVRPMYGEQVRFGRAMEEGVRLAVEEQNRQGGVLGKRVSLRIADNRESIDGAASAVRRLVRDEGVSAVIGDLSSRRTMAMAPLADELEVPLITPTATNPRVTRDGARVYRYVFRACFIDPYQGTVMARFARDHLHASRAAVLRDMANDYSILLADFFTNEFERLGGTVVAERRYRAGDQDFRGQLEVLAAKDPEVLYLPGYYDDVGRIAQQARRMGIRQPFLGGDGWDSPKVLDSAQGALDGSFFSNHGVPVGQDPSPQVQEFQRKFAAAYGNDHLKDDALIASLGYDSTRMLIAAMERAGTVAGPAVRDALEQTRDLPTVTGPITLNADHDAVKPALITVIEGGQFKYRATIQP